MKQCKMANKDTSLPCMLSAFYARFEQNARGAVSSALTAPDTPVPSVTTSNIRSVFLGVDPREATGSDGVPGQALRSCVGQLVEVFTDTFTLSLLQTEIPNCFKKITIIPVPDKAHAECCNDYRPVALTSIIMNSSRSWLWPTSAPNSQPASIPYSLPTDIT
eukprot:g32095.t1